MAGYASALGTKLSIIRVKPKSSKNHRNKSHPEHTKWNGTFTSPALLDDLHKVRSTDPFGPVQG